MGVAERKGDYFISAAALQVNWLELVIFHLAILAQLFGNYCYFIIKISEVIKIDRFILVS